MHIVETNERTRASRTFPAVRSAGQNVEERRSKPEMQARLGIVSESHPTNSGRKELNQPELHAEPMLPHPSLRQFTSTDQASPSRVGIRLCQVTVGGLLHAWPKLGWVRSGLDWDQVRIPSGFG